MRNIPFFDYPKLYLEDKKNIIQIIDKIASKGAFILQKELSDFEKNLAKFADVKHAIGVANATDGLELALMSIKLNPGDEVICCSHTMIATGSAIKISGGNPIPVEMGDDYLIDPEAVEEAINSNTVGIMPTQLNGRTCDMDKIMKIAEKNKLFVVEDAAQALGSKFNGKHAGTFGDASAISFYPAKVLGCFGDGGAVLTNNKNIFEKVYQLHDHGRDLEGNTISWGRNSRLDNLQAAILDHKLKSYSQVIKRRREIASIYEKLLSEIEEISLPPGPENNSIHFDVYQNYEIEANNRNDLKEYLKQKGVGTIIQWGGKGLHQWDNLGFDSYHLPKVEKFFEKCLLLPMNIFLNDEDVFYICSQIKNFYAI